MTAETYERGDRNDFWNGQRYLCGKLRRPWLEVGQTRVLPGAAQSDSRAASLAALAQELEASAWPYAADGAAYWPSIYASVTLGDLLMRVAEAYRMLDELFGPRRRPSTTHPETAGPAYGYIRRFRQ